MDKKIRIWDKKEKSFVHDFKKCFVGPEGFLEAPIMAFLTVSEASDWVIDHSELPFSQFDFIEGDFQQKLFKHDILEWRRTDWLEITMSRPGIVEGSKKICQVSEFDKTKEEADAIADLIVTAGNLSRKYNLSAVPEMVEVMLEQERLDQMEHLSEEWLLQSDKCKKLRASVIKKAIKI